jgi:sulfur carrier protein ThiS
VHFTQALQRHVSAPPEVVEGRTVRDALDAYFARHPTVRAYVVDERGAMRRHVTVFVNGEPLYDRETQADSVADRDELYVMQALSGG